MTLATGIEIAASGASSPALDKRSVGAPGAPRHGASMQGLTSSFAGEEVSGSVFGTGSFRSGWQSLVAALAPKMDSASEADTSDASLTGQARATEGGSASRTISASTGGIGLHMNSGCQSGTASSSINVGSRLDAVVAEASLTARGVRASEPTLAKVEAKKPAKASVAASASAQRSPRQLPADKPKVAATDSLPGAVSAAIATPVQSAPAPVVDTSMPQVREANPQMARTGTTDADHFATPKDGSLTQSFTPDELTPARVADGAKEDPAQRPRSKDENSITQGQGLPMPRRSPAPESVPQAPATLPDAHPKAAAIQDSSQSALPGEERAPSALQAKPIAPRQISSSETDTVQGQDTAPLEVSDPVPAVAPLSESHSAVPVREDRVWTREAVLTPEQRSIPVQSPGQSSGQSSSQSSVQEFPPKQELVQPLSLGSEATLAGSPLMESTPSVGRVQQQNTVRAPGSSTIEFLSASEDSSPGSDPGSAPVSASGRDQTQTVQPALAPARTGAPRTDSTKSAEAFRDGQQRAAAVPVHPESIEPAPDLSESPVASQRRTSASPLVSNPTPATASSREPSEDLAPDLKARRAATPDLSAAAPIAREPERLPGLFAGRQETHLTESVDGNHSGEPQFPTPSPIQAAGPSQIGQRMPVERRSPLETVVSQPFTSSPPAWSEETPSQTPAPPPMQAISDSAVAPVGGGTANFPASATVRPAIAISQPASASPLFSAVGAPASVVAPKSASTGGSKTLKQETSRPAHAQVNSEVVRHGSLPAAAQPSVASAEAPAASAGAASLRGAVRLAGEPLEGPAAAIATPGSRETFEALDSETTMGSPAWVHTGAQRAEVGFEDPSLGWVGVRAESAGGRVHAEVVPGSTDAAQALSGHLAGLNAYLAEHHAQVETVMVTTPESRSADLAGGGGGGEQMQQGAGQQPGQQTAQGAGNDSSPGLSSGSNTQASTLSGAAALQSGTGGGAEIEARAGMHISVMA